jgi:hypothetical protein
MFAFWNILVVRLFVSLHEMVSWCVLGDLGREWRHILTHFSCRLKKSFGNRRQSVWSGVQAIAFQMVTDALTSVECGRYTY